MSWTPEGDAPLSPVRSWWGRNWKWFLPVGCLGPFVLCGGGLAVVVGLLFGLLKSSEPYRVALARAKADATVQATLGEPIREGTFVSGNIATHNDNGVETGDADLSIPISGPKGPATIKVVARKAGGTWSYTTLKVVPAGQGAPIDLPTRP